MLAQHHLADEAADLADVAGYFGQAFLCRVEFLQHDHRQEDIVLFESEDRGRVVHQHVGVDDVQAFIASHQGLLLRIL